jgi:hypothetical protein
MNQKMLYVAIVAVVAIVVVIGVLVSGAGQSGPLAGEIAQPAPTTPRPTISPTTLTLGVTVLQEKEDGMCCRILQFSGTLTDANGNGVPGKTVTVMINGNPPYSVKTATTDANGAYSEMYSEYSPATYYAAFAGDSAYRPSQSSLVSS